MKSKLVLFSLVSILAVFVQAKSPVQQVQADIFYEIAHGNTKSIKAWLKSKPNLSVRNQEGQTVLAFVALTGQRDLVQMFLDAGVEINAVDNAGKTALDYSVEFGHVKIICDLLKSGGKVNNLQNLYNLKLVMKDRAKSSFWRFFKIIGYGIVGMFCILLGIASLLSGPEAIIVGYIGAGMFMFGLPIFAITSFICSIPQGCSWLYAIKNNDYLLQSRNVVALV